MGLHPRVAAEAERPEALNPPMTCFSREYLARLYPENTDYAKREYGVIDAGLDAFVKRAKAEIARDRKAGRMTHYTGDFRAAIERLS